MASEPTVPTDGDQAEPATDRESFDDGWYLLIEPPPGKDDYLVIDVARLIEGSSRS